MLVGNECWGTAGAAPLPVRRHLFQDFSLPSQPRDRSRPLGEILAGEGIGRGSRVGVLGWKTYADRSRIEAPAFIADALRALTGPAGLVENANDLMIDPADGLRVINDVDQLAVFEHAACQTSDGIRRLLAGLRPGMTEAEAVRLLNWNGMPLSCHLMLTAGPRASFGLLSPGDRVIATGDPLTVAFGVWGALNCRAGFVVEDAARAAADAIGDYVERLVAPYFEAVAEWYGALHVGQRGGVLQEIIDRACRRPAARHRATTSSGSSGRTSRRSPSGTGRCTSASRAARSRRSSIAGSAIPSSGSGSTPATSWAWTSG